MKEPDFFLVGAPKSGTTSMWQYLRQHPQVYMAPEKECSYYFQEARHKPISRQEYLDLFEDASPGQRVGEASVLYLYGEPAARRIKENHPDADILIMLRNPVKLLHSLHSDLVYRGYEDIEDFGAALGAEEDRKQGRRIPPGAPYPPLLFYTEGVGFSEQVERYFRLFGRHNVHVIIFSDFASNTLRSYRRFLRFLGVDDSFEPNLETHNPNTRSRSSGLMYWRYNYPDFLRRIGQMLVPSRLLRMRLLRYLEQFNTVEADRPDMPPELRARLEKRLEPEVHRLEDVLDRNLNHWYQSD